VRIALRCNTDSLYKAEHWVKLNHCFPAYYKCINVPITLVNFGENDLTFKDRIRCDFFLSQNKKYGPQTNIIASFGVLMAVTRKFPDSWYVTPCSLNIYRRFEVMWYIHLQSIFSALASSQPIRQLASNITVSSAVWWLYPFARNFRNCVICKWHMKEETKICVRRMDCRSIED
jgi:hypothetical protein